MSLDESTPGQSTEVSISQIYPRGARADDAVKKPKKA